MNALHEPLQLPSGLVLANRIMKAAMSEALADARHAPDERLSGSMTGGAVAATGYLSPET